MLVVDIAGKIDTVHASMPKQTYYLVVVDPRSWCIHCCHMILCSSLLRQRCAVPLVHLYLTFSGLVCILALWGRQEPCPFTTRLRVLKLVSNAEHVAGSTHSLDQPFFTMLLELVAQVPYIDLEDIRPAFKIHAPDAVHQE